ncbi:MAG: ATP-grasp domain-containing protein [Deltaproteobacteria bacterium]|nr:ATP-grasp domain-containing protein [Deltaproteobacteria bacterium]
MSVNVLITSAGRRVELLRLFQKSIQKRSGGIVWAADINPRSPAMIAADKSVTVPRCTSPEYIPRLLSFCKSNQIGLLVPTIDTELPVLASHRKEFLEIGTWVHISDEATIAIAQNKVKTHQWLSSNSFPVPYQVSASEALKEDWKTPRIAKPIFGSASQGIFLLKNRAHLERLALDDSNIIQVIAPGIEYTIDVFLDNDGRCQVTVPRRRLEVRAGEVSKGLTCNIPSLMELAKQVAEKLPGAKGVLNIQIFYDQKTGAKTIIEINPRFGGGVPLSVAAGAPLVDWTVASSREEACDFASTSWKPDLLMLRYDASFFVDNKELISC